MLITPFPNGLNNRYNGLPSEKASPLRFNTAQMQQLSRVNREQLRHWRKVLPPLEGRDGRSDTYSFTEVVALAVLEELVNGLAVSVSHLSAFSSDLFALLSESPELSSISDTLYLTKEGNLSIDIPEADVFVTVHVHPFIERIKSSLSTTPKAQLSFDLT